MFELLLNNLRKVITLTEKDEAYIKSVFEPMKVKRKQFLLKEGQRSTGTYFVNTGCLRFYTKDGNGVEHIVQFAPSDWWTGDLSGKYSNKLSYYNIDAIEDSQVLYLPYDSMNDLFEQIPQFERFMRIIIEKSAIAGQTRLVEIMSIPAFERYQSFCNRYPMLINAIAQKHIAAYVGVTPEFLSKMRGEIARGKKKLQ
jgi:CRP-like cAMP-binding protein